MPMLPFSTNAQSRVTPDASSVHAGSKAHYRAEGNQGSCTKDYQDISNICLT